MNTPPIARFIIDPAVGEVSWFGLYGRDHNFATRDYNE